MFWKSDRGYYEALGVSRKKIETPENMAIVITGPATNPRQSDGDGSVLA
jgi:hypothetical protein